MARNKEKRPVRYSYRFAVLAVETPPQGMEATARPLVMALYTDTDTWVMRRKFDTWSAERVPHRLGRPLMEPLIWNATSEKPFGQSRPCRSFTPWDFVQLPWLFGMILFPLMIQPFWLKTNWPLCWVPKVTVWPMPPSPT